MRTPMPQIVTLALFVCAGTLCVSASSVFAKAGIVRAPKNEEQQQDEQRDEQQSNSRRGNYGFGTRNAPQTTTEYYTTKVISEKDDQSDTQTIPSVSGKILEWSDEGICIFRPKDHPNEKYFVKLWLVDMPEEGQPNYEELMKFIRSHSVYGEGCLVELRIIATNPAHPEYKIGILGTSNSSSCQKALWGSGYCGLDDSEREIDRNTKESKKLLRIFSRIQKEEQEPEKEDQKTSYTEGAGETVGDGDDSGSKTGKEAPKKDDPPATQPEDKGAHVPGYGTTTERDNTLKGILFDLTHQQKSKQLNTASRRGAWEEKEQYESRENQSGRLRDSVQKLSTTWNLNILKNSKKYPVSPTIRYTTSIYIPTNSSGTAYGSNGHGFAIPAGESSRSMPSWLCYYEGYFGVPEEGDYRFVGYAEHVMLVGVDLGGTGKKTQTVLYAFIPQQGFGAAVKCGKDWEPSRFCGTMGDDGLEVDREESKDKRLYKGSWLHLVPDKRYFIKIAFGTLSESMKYARLGIQKKERDTDDNFPLFTLEKVSFPVYHNNSFGVRSSSGSRSASTTWELREKGQYNSTCVFAAPPEKKTPAKPR